MLLFTLDDSFVFPYEEKPLPFGYGELGEFTYRRTYAREDNPRLDGEMENWTDTVRRVTEGTFTILLEHVREHGVQGWNMEQVSDISREFFDRLWRLQWTPPGRGLWAMGTPFVHEREVYEALQNCGFISTKRFATEGGDIAAWFLEKLMVGVGVGANMDGAESQSTTIHKPRGATRHYDVPDSRQGWAEYVRLVVNSYLEGSNPIEGHLHLIRPRGTPIKGFGGRAEGPEVLATLVSNIRFTFERKPLPRTMGTEDLADIFNFIGMCVTAGNVRRSAEILVGSPGNADFLALKDDYTHRPQGAYSNNSVLFEEKPGVVELVDLSQRAHANGEPGVGFMYNAWDYGRMNGMRDSRDIASVGPNPCFEILLGDKELCTLSEIHMNRTNTKEDYLQSARMAHLYSQIVTLGSERISDAGTREIMMKNRRTGVSQTGVVQFKYRFGEGVYSDWSDHGYQRIRNSNTDWASWLGINPSNRVTCVKPSGTVSLLSGATPGIHYPHSATYIRRQRVSSQSVLVDRAQAAGYPVEPDVTDPEGTMVIEFPVSVGEGENLIPNLSEVTLNQQVEMAESAARFHADNAVSFTGTFDPNTHTPEDLEVVFERASRSLKSMSVLPSEDHGYAQMPYEAITLQEYEERAGALKKIDFSGVRHEADDMFCDGELCEIEHNHSS